MKLTLKWIDCEKKWAGRLNKALGWSPVKETFRLDNEPYKNSFLSKEKDLFS